MPAQEEAEHEGQNRQPHDQICVIGVHCYHLMALMLSRSMVPYNLYSAINIANPTAASAAASAIENSAKTGLSQHSELFREVWEKAKEYWLKFKGSEEWKKVKEPEKKRYEDWFRRVSGIAARILGPNR